MSYSFHTLLPADFEDLVRDLIGRMIGVSFEGFGAGPDDGIDGRYASSGTKIILQAKHLAGSSFATLKSKVKAERPKIDKLQPTRYLLATSRGFSPKGKAALAKIIGPHLKSEDDILGPEDLNTQLRKHADIARSHIKLWLSGAGMLEAMIRPQAQYFTAMTREEIEAKVRVYAPNPSLKNAFDKLDNLHVLIVAGPPGVGKSTLAEMLAWSYLGEGWELVAIRSLDDGLAAINDLKKQVFFFDDFLGSIALDSKTLSRHDNDLARFMKRIRKSPNARFILTTRAHLLEEARATSERLSGPDVEVTRYLLDVEAYSRAIRARILYNHLVVANTPAEYVSALIASGRVPDIVDHQNYSPRIVEWMTDRDHLTETTPEKYAEVFVAGLDDPSRLWDFAFRNSLQARCQHLLIALFFATDGSVLIEDLSHAYNAVHVHLCGHYGLPSGLKDFEESLQLVEGGFVAIRGKYVSCINPSLRDYLARYLLDEKLLHQFAGLSISAKWAMSVWRFGSRGMEDSHRRKQLANAFLPIAQQLATFPIWKQLDAGGSYRLFDIGNAARIDLLMGLCTESDNNAFASSALDLAANPISGFVSWRDAETLVELLRTLEDEAHFKQTPITSALVGRLNSALIDLLRQGMPIDELETIADLVSWGGHFQDDLHEALRDAARKSVSDTASIIADYDSEATLVDHIETLTKLAAVGKVSAIELATAVSAVNDRIGELDEEAVVADPPSVEVPDMDKDEKFDDAALASLFESLLN